MSMTDLTTGDRAPKIRTLVVFLFVLVISAIPVFAQNLPTLDFSGHSADTRPELLEKATPSPPPLTLPPPPVLKEPAAGVPVSAFIRKVVVTGCTAFSPEQLSKVTSAYENKKLTMTDLESLRRDLTLLYVNNGYINSGAVIPDQSLGDGTVAINIIEGRLSRIDVQGTDRFAKSFIERRVALGADKPVNIIPLQERLQLLQQDQRIQRVHADLRPGSRPGDSELKVIVEEKPPISLSFAFNNYQSPSVGAERGLVTLAHQNLTGNGDILSFTYGFSSGINPLIDTWYAVPLNAYDTTLMFRYRNDDSKVVDRTFKSLEIVSKTESFEISIRQPVYRSLTQELALSISGEHERNNTYLLGEPFSFSPGVDNGQSVVIPLRFSQEWTYRTQKQVIAARSRLSFGLGTWDATVHDTREGMYPDGRFFAWLGQLQWARILDYADIQLLSRLDVQCADRSLLPVEQMGIGGRYTVRGYRENLLVRDQAVIFSFETRIPLIQNELWAEYLHLAPFFDYANGTNIKLPTSGPEDISSTGLGLRWGAAPLKLPFQLRADSEVYWGYRLKHMSLPHNDPQDYGFHYQIAITGYF